MYEYRLRGRVVRAPDSKSGDPALITTSWFVRGGPWFNTSTALLQSQLVCLLLVRVLLKLLSLFQLFVSGALKSPSGER